MPPSACSAMRVILPRYFTPLISSSIGSKNGSLNLKRSPRIVEASHVNVKCESMFSMPILSHPLVKREAIVAEALTWKGTKYHANASVKQVGVDCARFLAACYRAAGFDIPKDFLHLPHGWFLHAREEKLLNIVERHMRNVETPLPGDIALFKVGRVFGHSALVVDWPTVIHTDAFVPFPRVEIASADQWPLARREVKFYSPFA